MTKKNLYLSEDSVWGEMVRKAEQEGFLNEEENREWLELARMAMESGVTKEQFRAFLEAEARKRNWGKP